MNTSELTALPQRKVARVEASQLAKNTPNHTAKAVIPQGQWAKYDPFLLMMDDDFGPGAFGAHPHRGFETITYVMDGAISHSDSKGNSGTIYTGDIQLMTAGGGVIHLEDPPAGHRVHLFQLWLNLPADQKMSEPRYQDLLGAEMPNRTENGASLRIYSGSSAGIEGPALNHQPVRLVAGTIPAGTTIHQDLRGGENTFITVVSGSATIGAAATPVPAGHTAWLELSDSTETAVAITAETDLHIFLAAAEPLQEPVVAHGPFVMNSAAQIEQAFSDYQAGTFAG
ncbi:pirin family protein [Corynebacterium sp. A21]|uniref:pirin family protein n=1 Tax=Corynebacterium sp. A21 TaxID=3457318 RepID=UPI003FD2C465